MIDKIGINQAVFKAQAEPAVTKNVTNPIQEKQKTNEEFFVDKKTADAVKSYNFVSNPTEITKPVSFEDYISKLEKSGLKEGKDFDIDKAADGAAVFIHKGDKLYKTVYWYDGFGKDNYVGYEQFSYPINSDITTVCERYDENGILTEKTKTYKNPDAHKDLIPDDISIDTTPEEYIEKVKMQNKNYEIDRKQFNDNKYTIIIEKGTDGKYEKITNFHEGKNFKAIGRSDTPDGKGNLIHGIDIRKADGLYELEISDYVKDLGIKNNVKY